MTVPASKRTVGRSAYLTQCRRVANEFIEIMRGWPKRRSFTEAEHISGIAYDLLHDVCEADSIFAATVPEAEMRLAALNGAMGNLCTLAAILDGWYDRPVYTMHDEIDEMGNTVHVQKPVVSTGRIENLAKTIALSIKLLKGSIKQARARLRKLEQDEVPADEEKSEPEDGPSHPKQNRAYSDAKRGQTYGNLPPLGNSTVENMLANMLAAAASRRPPCPEALEALEAAEERRQTRGRNE